ncbi:unnamed protein product [Bursaphelenchus okinawaensis]|uniref:Ubiquitin-like-conjugating enzyme ATG10 n=1 Tax=Bursaphelenchus okinawaensis TaxID=465554 RepID=A0A811K6C8_9BILA|nr:unnamed protein product [Bursaphelenchus okinawaensis]CAG9092362.1 unnamed protein product [Bursaphelenchus okinawaensis]
MKFSEKQFEDDLKKFVSNFNQTYDEQFKVVKDSTLHPSAELRSFKCLADSTPCVQVVSIVYNKIYECPQLFFNYYTDNGQLILFDKIKQHLQKVAAPSDDSIWSYISQNEHPTKGIAFYNLHPCKTVEFFGELEDSEGLNTIECWLSVFGAFLGLDLESVRT